MVLIKREKYLSRVRPYFNKQLIKVITGQRRVGKSYLLKQIVDELANLTPTGNFIYIDKEKFEFDEIKSYIHLMEYIKKQSLDKTNYVLSMRYRRLKVMKKLCAACFLMAITIFTAPVAIHRYF